MPIGKKKIDSDLDHLVEFEKLIEIKIVESRVYLENLFKMK